MPDGADMADRTPSVARSLIVATLLVWALVVLATALIGVYPMIAAIGLVLVLVGVALAVRIAEIAFGLVSLVAGGLWMLFWCVLTLHYGLGVGTDEYHGDALERGANFWPLAIFGAFTSLGLIPLFLGGSFVFGAGPLAKRVNEPGELAEGPSRRGTLAVGVEVALVVAILVIAVVVVRHEFSGPYPGYSSISNAPGP